MSCLFYLPRFPEYVLLKYNDGLYQVRSPAELTEEYLTERHTHSNDLFGKDQLEKGMRIRAKWNTQFRISKAIVVAVGADVNEINALFDTLDGLRKAEVKQIYQFSDHFVYSVSSMSLSASCNTEFSTFQTKKRNVPPKPSQRMVNRERVELDRNKRAKLNDRRLFRNDSVATRGRNGESDEETEDLNHAPGPIRKTADGKRLIIPLRKRSNSMRRSKSRSSSSSRSSRSASIVGDVIRDRIAVASTSEAAPVLSDGEEHVNEDDFSENDWTRSEEGECLTDEPRFVYSGF